MASVSKRQWTHKDATKEAWTVRYFDEKGVRRSRQFEQKKVAEAFKRKVEREIEDGTHTPDTESRTVADAADDFIKWQGDRVREGKLGRSRHVVCEGVFRNHIIPAVGEVLFAQLKWADVERLRQQIGAKALSPMSIKHIMGLMKQLEDFARKRGWTKARIVQDVNRDHGGARTMVVEVPTPEEVRAIIEAAGTPKKLPGRKGSQAFERAARFRECYVLLAALCGLRFGEISALTCEAIDFDASLIRVRHAMTKWDEMKGPKTTAGIRDVPMPNIVADRLREWIGTFMVPEPRGLIFRSATGGMVRNTSFYSNHWGPLLRSIGLQGKGAGTYHFHALRHFAGSMMLHYGMPLPEVSATLGHQKFDMTLQVYIHRIAGGSRSNEVAERMAASPLLRLGDARMTQGALTA